MVEKHLTVTLNGDRVVSYLADGSCWLRLAHPAPVTLVQAPAADHGGHTPQPAAAAAGSDRNHHDSTDSDNLHVSLATCGTNLPTCKAAELFTPHFKVRRLGATGAWQAWDQHQTQLV